MKKVEAQSKARTWAVWRALGAESYAAKQFEEMAQVADGRHNSHVLWYHFKQWQFAVKVANEAREFFE